MELIGFRPIVIFFRVTHFSSFSCHVHALITGSPITIFARHIFLELSGNPCMIQLNYTWLFEANFCSQQDKITQFYYKYTGVCPLLPRADSEKTRLNGGEGQSADLGGWGDAGGKMLNEFKICRAGL